MSYSTKLNITKDGFRLDELNRKIKDTSLLSLKIAMKAYFSTYHSMKNNLNVLENPQKYKLNQEEIDYNYRSLYYENYNESLVHFHHYFELTFKNILQEEFKLKEEEIGRLEFSETIKILVKKISQNSTSNLQFILNEVAWLEDINYLRNRLLHRGLFMLRYASYDELIGAYVLPLIKQLEKYLGNNEMRKLWMYEKLDCSIEPIDEIIKAFKSQSYNMKKIALLKELGRAAYNNIMPNKIWESFNRKEYISIIEKATEQYRINVSEVKKCPVCGLNTLILYSDSDGEYDEEANDGTYKTMWEFIFQVKCSNCGFELFDEIENGRNFGFNELEDYFWSRYL